MSFNSRGGDLFIVDNSVRAGRGCATSRSGASIAKELRHRHRLLRDRRASALDGKWQKLGQDPDPDGCGDDARTRKALLEAVRTEPCEAASTTASKPKRTPTPSSMAFPRSWRRCGRARSSAASTTKDKFHAKAYITHAKLEVVGSQALVGSTNFTRPGLTQNVELNVQIKARARSRSSRSGSRRTGSEANDVTDAIIETIVERHVREYSPFEVYAKALQEFFRGHELTATEWDETRSGMFPKLDRYQQEAYWALMKIARQHGGAFLCDGVGLGKTFVGLMLIERLVLHEGKRVVLFAPKAAKEASGSRICASGCPTSAASAGAPTSATSPSSATPTSAARATSRSASSASPSWRTRWSSTRPITSETRARGRRRRTASRRGTAGSIDLLDNGDRPKTRLSVDRHADQQPPHRLPPHGGAFHAAGRGVLRPHARRQQSAGAFQQPREGAANAVRARCRRPAEHVAEAQEILATDEIFKQLVVQRSRAYARESQIRETGKAAPSRSGSRRRSPSTRSGRPTACFSTCSRRRSSSEKPLFTLRDLLSAWPGTRARTRAIDPIEKNRQKQVVGLIRTQFLKRFESSVLAFELSCDRLLKKLLAFVEVHSETDAEKRRLERWKDQNATSSAMQWPARLWGDDEEEPDEDIVLQEMFDTVERLDREEYNVSEMIQETFLDLDQIVNFLDEVRKFEAKHDDKLQKLIRLLRSKELADQKVLIFTEFADTARYLKRQLDKAGIEGIEEVDSGSKGNRAAVIRRFAPYYNGTTSGACPEGPERDPRPHFHRRALGRPEPSGRHPDDQLRHPLEPRPPDAADRPRGPPHKPGHRGAARPQSPGGRGIPRQGELLELPASGRAERNPEPVHQGHAELC